MRKRTPLALAVAAALAAAPSAAAAPPANDDFESAAPIAAKASGTVAEATRQPAEPAHGPSSVWYAFRPAQSGRFAVDLPRATDSATFVVYTGGDLATLRRVAAPRDTSRAIIDAVAGTTYWIAVVGTYAESTAT